MKKEAQEHRQEEGEINVSDQEEKRGGGQKEDIGWDKEE